jgi:hypothetical protein
MIRAGKKEQSNPIEYLPKICDCKTNACRRVINPRPHEGYDYVWYDDPDPSPKSRGFFYPEEDSEEEEWSLSYSDDEEEEEEIPPLQYFDPCAICEEQVILMPDEDPPFYGACWKCMKKICYLCSKKGQTMQSDLEAKLKRMNGKLKVFEFRLDYPRDSDMICSECCNNIVSKHDYSMRKKRKRDDLGRYFVLI